MKRSWIGLGILLVLLGASVVTAWAVNRIQQPIAQELAQAAEEAREENWEGVRTSLAAAKNRWDRWRKWVACVADHTPMEELNGLLVQLEQYAFAGEKTELAALCAEAATRALAIAQAHGLSWWSFW